MTTVSSSEAMPPFFRFGGSTSSKPAFVQCNAAESSSFNCKTAAATISGALETQKTLVNCKLSIKTEDCQLTHCYSSPSAKLSEIVNHGLGCKYFYKIENLPELYVNEKLTVVCDLSFAIEKTQRILNDPDEPLRKKLKYDTRESETQFLENMKTLYSLGSFSDLTIICGDQNFLCHKNVLASRSEVFKDMLENEKEKINDMLEITDTSPDALKILIDYIYTGKIPEDLGNVATKLFDLASKYNLQILSKACEISLLEQLTDVNALETLVALDKHKSTTLAKNDVIKYIIHNAKEIINTEGFVAFAKEQTELMIEIFRGFVDN